MLEKIMDLPVILQGALGSILAVFMLWALRKTTDKLFYIVDKHNKSWREETLEFEQLQSLYMVAEPQQKANYILLAIYGVLNRSIVGIVYFCLAIMFEIFYPIKLVLIGFAIIFLFRALKAIPFVVRDGKSMDWHHGNIDKIQIKLDEIREQRDAKASRVGR